MSHQSDYSALDRPELLQFVFYPRKDSTIPPPNATDHLIPVEKGVSISCRFYVHHSNPSLGRIVDRDSPSILYFRGNGEVVSDYDYIAPLYNQLGVNLFVADYRGYGSSGGVPTFTNMVADAHPIFKGFWEILQEGGYSGKVFLMGRSLGSVSAIELASHYGEKIEGLILESGFASTVRSTRLFELMTRLGFPKEFLGIKDFGFPNLTKIRTVTLPTLIIHAEFDSLIPLTEARDLFENVATKEKRLVIIPGADHNTIMMVGMEPYFKAIEEFVFA
jgi:alpha-beta hydrolase superfamily lysophospholipase